MRSSILSIYYSSYISKWPPLALIMSCERVGTEQPERRTSSPWTQNVFVQSNNIGIGDMKDGPDSKVHWVDILSWDIAEAYIWPPSSLDINTKDFAVVSVKETRVSVHSYSNEAALKEVFQLMVK